MNQLITPERQILLPPHIAEVEEAARRKQSELSWAMTRLRAKGIPLIAGGDVAPIYHPLGPPTVSNNLITVDLALRQPTRVTRMIMDLTLQRFVADRIFSNAGGVTGGAVIYDQATANELWTSRDVQQVAPGTEFPLVTAERMVPKIAEVEKWGGKVYIVDEARDRNDATALANAIRQLSNTIVRKLNARAIAELETSITASGQTTAGRNWQAVVTAGTSASNANAYPARDFALAWQLAEADELGVQYNLWIVNPQEYAQLIVLYGAGGLNDLLDAMDIDLYASNRVTPGTAYAVAMGQVGEMRVEQPLGTETWREPETQRNWIQSSVRPVMYVTNPFAVLKFTGLAG